MPKELRGLDWGRVLLVAGGIIVLGAVVLGVLHDEPMLALLNMMALHSEALLVAVVIFLIAVAGSLVFFQRFRHALLESEARARAVLTTVVDGIITIDPKGTILSYNPACERIFQYSAAEVVGRNVKILMPEAYSSEHDGYLARYGKTGEKKVIGIGREVEGRRKDGSTFPLDLAVSELQLAEGRVFTGIVRDISERKAAERALKDSEIRGQTVLDTVVDGIITIDEFGVVQSYNKACVRIFGYAAEEVVGRNIKMLMPQNFAIAHDGYLAHYLDTGEKKIIGIGRQVEGQRKDSSTFPLDLAVSQAEINGRPIFTGLVRDISERRAADEALKASEARYDMVIRGMSAGFWEWDLAKNEVFWSEITRRIIGVDDTVKPDLEVFVSRRHPDDTADVHKKLEAVIRGEGNFDAEFRFMRPDGKTIWLHVTAICSFDAEGKPVRMVGSLSDITAAKTFEAEREQLIAALAQSNRELDEFAYVASHDLKAPLRVIDNASSWLEEDLSDKLDAESRENLELLRNRVRRMDRLLDDLLEYSRVGRKTAEQVPEEVTGSQLQEEVLALVPARDGFEVVFDPSFAEIRVPDMPLKQILINLIGNALKHHDRETGTVTVKAETRRGKYLISVIDDGPGIPLQFREQIFKMFQTLRPRDRIEGSGMGLAIVRKHIDVLREQVWVEAEGDRGSIFRFTYPSYNTTFRSIEA